jgi:hypothetical protein
MKLDHSSSGVQCTLVIDVVEEIVSSRPTTVTQFGDGSSLCASLQHCFSLSYENGGLHVVKAADRQI